MRVFPLIVGCVILAAADAADDKKVICYFGSWSVYRPGNGKFDISDIEPSLCTHIIYTFVGLDGNNVKVLDPWQDLSDQWGKDGFGRFNRLRARYPSVKTLIAMGGWNEGSRNYSQMAATAKTREIFADNVILFVKKWGFDGFDLDWEYPARRGGALEDRVNYIELLKALKSRFDREGLVLSAAVAATESLASQSYNIPEMSKYLHFINMMAYDFHTYEEAFTGLNAPLLPSSSDSPTNTKLNVQAAVEYWLSQGVSKEKLILGMPLYGHSFTLRKPSDNGIGASVRGAGIAGPYTREPGMMGYNEICEMHARGGWRIVFHEEHRAPYAVKKDQWIGYDNVKSIREKAELVKKLDLGGGMVWSIETDDFRGACGEKYPLLKTINAVLRGAMPVPEEPTPPEILEPTEDPTVEPVQPQRPCLCKSAGSIPDPASCGYIICVANGDGGFNEIPMQCAAGLCFNPKIGVCDWPTP